MLILWSTLRQILPNKKLKLHKILPKSLCIKRLYKYRLYKYRLYKYPLKDCINIDYYLKKDCINIQAIFVIMTIYDHTLQYMTIRYHTIHVV